MNMTHQKSVAIIGAGPAGLMAAEVLSQHGVAVTVYDAMPSVGRKFLMAGLGGLNITHSEDLPLFLNGYVPCDERLLQAIRAFDNQAVVAWIEGLGLKTFVGSSGRVFPTEMKAAPLLRAWLARLRAAGVRFEMRHRWIGWDEAGALCFECADGVPRHVRADACVLALGGASVPRLGSDARWCELLANKGVTIHAFRPSNCGYDVAAWSTHLQQKFARTPIKPVLAQIRHEQTGELLFTRQGELMLTETGMEGGLMYAASRCIREQIERCGQAVMYLDLLPQHSAQRVLTEVSHPRGSRSMSSHLQSRLGLTGIKTALMYECLSKTDWADTLRIAALIKALPIVLHQARPIAEAISSAGGIAFNELTDTEHNAWMLRKLPSVFCAGEMLDWDAPTGGYLLTACMATGRAAGLSVAGYLDAA